MGETKHSLELLKKDELINIIKNLRLKMKSVNKLPENFFVYKPRFRYNTRSLTVTIPSEFAKAFNIIEKRYYKFYIELIK